MNCIKFLQTTIVAWVLSLSAVMVSGPTFAKDSMAKFNENNELPRPTSYREWIFIGAPVTPNDLNKRFE